MQGTAGQPRGDKIPHDHGPLRGDALQWLHTAVLLHWLLVSSNPIAGRDLQWRSRQQLL
jgi:hypothetical protein